MLILRRSLAFLFVPLFLVTLATAYAETNDKNPFAGNAEAIAAGKTIYEGVCAGYCHATETSTRAGRCPNLFDCEWKHGSGDEEVFHTIAEGVAKTEMIGFKGRIPDEMLWKVIAYMRSVSRCADAPPAAPAH